MSKGCEARSAVLMADLKKLGFDASKGGFIQLCTSCQKKYGMKTIVETDDCIFCWNEDKPYLVF